MPSHCRPENLRLLSKGDGKEAVKRRRRMTAEQKSCAWPGCSKPPSSSLGYPPHLTCGHLHHLLLMASRFNLNLPHSPHQQVLDRNDKGLCVLRSCSKAPWPGHYWCSRSHYLTWLHEVYSSLSCEQICKLPECTCHVYVDEDNGPWEFCGWRHRQQAVMQKALQDLKNRAPHSPLPSVESEHKNHPAIKCLLQSLKHFAQSSISPKGIKVDGDFFGKHPWEVLSGDGQACFLIVPCKFTSGGKCRKRDNITKDNFHWKQQGPAKKKHGYLKKYYTYKKLKARKKEKDEEQETVVFTMKEYTLEDVTTHSLIKLCKGQQLSQGRGCKVDFDGENEQSSSMLDFEDGQFFLDSMYKEGPPGVSDWLGYGDEWLLFLDDSSS